QRGVCVEGVVGDAFFIALGQQTAHLSNPRIRLAYAVEDQVLFSIVAAGDPGGTAEAALHRESVPAVAFIGTVFFGNGADTPQLFTIIRIVSGDVAATRLGVTTAGHALNDLAVNDHGTAG